MGLAGDIYAASIKNPPTGVPRVVDTHNNLVGQVIGASAPGFSLFQPTDATIVLNITVPSIVVQVTPNNIFGNAYMYFTSTNCSGQPYFYADGLVDQPHLFPIVGVVGGNLYRLRANSPPVAINVYSALGFSTICSDLGGANPINGIIADLISNLSTQFIAAVQLCLSLDRGRATASCTTRLRSTMER